MAIEVDCTDVTFSSGSPMKSRFSRRRMLVLMSAGSGAGVLAACGGAPVAQEAQPTLAVVQPSGLTPETAPTSAPAPTVDAPVAPTVAPTAAAETGGAASGEFVLNGVTLPYNRNETIVMDQTDYSVFDSFNIYIPNGNEFASGFQQQVIEYLWYANYVTGEITPWLATGYSYNDDYTQLTLNIREGVNWNDGQPFTADDVAFTMNMLKNDPSLGADGSSDAKFWKEVTAPDPQTVLITFTDPQPRAHQIFICKICTGFTVQPKHVWEGQDVKTFRNNPPVATGPWMLERTYVEQKMFVWKRNENYWNKDKMPAAKYLIYRRAPTADQALPEAVAAFSDSGGGLDYDIYTQNAAQLSKINQVAYLDPCPRGVWFNCAQPPFDKAEFRRAMSMLINRPKIAENIWAPPSQPANGPWAAYRNLDPYINQEANEKWGVFNYDPDKALELLESIGYKQENGQLIGLDGKQVSFEIITPGFAAGDKPAREFLIAQDLSEEANKLGMATSVKPLQGSTMWNTVDEGGWGCGSWWMCGATVDPLELFKNYTSDLAAPIGTRAVGNAQRLQDSAYDEVVNKLKVITPDAPEATALYKQAYDEFLRACPGVPVIQTIYTAYWNTTYWSGGLEQSSLYTVPFNWWGQYMFVTLNAKPA
jgi:peptide/nickel transport system substrate-binding protein